MIDATSGARSAAGRAEDVFAEFVASDHEDEDAAFEALCAELPKQSEELRRLRSSWLEVAGVFRSVSLKREPSACDESDGELTRRLSRRLQSFSRYRIEDEIARGGQGSITRVWEDDLRRHLAMKRLHPEFVEGNDKPHSPRASQSLHRFLEEAQVTGQLGHPGVPPVHELGMDGNGRPFFTMPLVRGQELNKIFRAVREGRDDWTTARALGVFLKVCEAVGYAHSKGVLHRDLKPSNVMVGRFGETYVMDWGLAHVGGRDFQPDIRLRGDADVGSVHVSTDRGSQVSAEDSPLLTMDGDVVGTPAYMAPEQARGELDSLTERSDVYSIGAMLYHMLSGYAPYMDKGESTSGYAVLTRVLQGPPSSLSDLAPDAPSELVAIADAAMSRDPERRYASASNLADDLVAYLDHRPVSAHSPGLWHTLKLSVMRHRAVAISTAIAAAVLLVVSVTFVINLDAARDDERTAKDAALVAKGESQRRYDIIEGGALLAAEPGIYPVAPESVPRMRAWIEQTRSFMAKSSGYESRLAGGLLGSSIDAREGVENMLSSAEELAEPLARAESFLAIAAELELVSLEQQAAAWDNAIESIEQSELYGGLTIAPQLGLVPLEPSPQSGLWEFWHIASGDRPVRDEARVDEGAWLMRPETGMVFVLVPEGVFMMGAPESEKELQASWHLNETQHEESLAAFFVSKYELTQGQYSRVVGENHSVYQPDRMEEISESHPAEAINWHRSADVARRYALRLPWEREWEYVCRAGTRSAFYWGDAESGAEGKENLRDARFWKTRNTDTFAPWVDGHRYHAPVGSYGANPWGLYDMQGNVTEWCQDAAYDLRSSTGPWTEQDHPAGEQPPKSWTRVRRGSSAHGLPRHGRSAFRKEDVPSGANQTHGVRLVRDLICP